MCAYAAGVSVVPRKDLKPKPRVTSVALSPDRHALLKEIALRERISLNAIINEALDRWLAAYSKEKGRPL